MSTSSSPSSRSSHPNPLPIPLPRPRGASLALLLLGLLIAAPAAAQAPDITSPADSLATASEFRVGVISVEGNTSTDSTRILRSFGVRPGTRYLPDVVRRGIRQLFGLGLFEDVWTTAHERGDVVDIVIHVVERPRVAKVEFRGNRKREDSELEKKISLRPGATYSPTAVRAEVDSLVRYYREEGFAQATVDAEVDTAAGPRQVTLRFVIREGERVRIREVLFHGNTAFNDKTLRKQIKSRRKGFFGGGQVKTQEEFPENERRLLRYYRSRGYRDVRVAEQTLTPGATPKALKLEITLEEGPVYTQGGVSWQGNTVMSDTELARGWKGEEGERYDISKIEAAQSYAYAEYAERGFLYLNVEPVETVEGTTVNVRFDVAEGAPSDVRYVNISGNRGTREKVIRREMKIHEGERFKRSLLVRTQGDIFRLGIFEDVQIDFSPADSTDVDINLRVKEKQVGTASAGAGFTNESGLTGFLELGHNNVLGNGQSLQLHLERGSQREDYFLSFTEPWFRDTPTLLGFSVFNTQRERDLFKERRRGGTARIGRPLPWPDFSRGSVTYRLEGVKLDSLGLLDPATRLALSGLRFGDPQLTSSLETIFSRNDTDNPFYPTRGSRLTVQDEFAGGPFGGSVHFHKHRIEGRYYMPSFLRWLVPAVFGNFTTMVKSRVGLLGEYGDQSSRVPDYERFRLGGGTTIDPLRGYGDYQVVPGKFVQDVPVAFRSDTTIAGTDTTITQVPTRFSKVRYPGGRFMHVFTLEQQFPIAHPLHGVLFFDAGNTWDLWHEIKPLDLKLGAGLGFRMEIPLLGNIGFDYGYGFDRDDGPRWAGHFLLGNVSF